MSTLDLKVLEKLDETDLLSNKSKYKKLKEEISIRRNEIVKGEILNHDEIWKNLDV